MKVNVLPNGRLVLPISLRRKLGVEKGGQLIADLEGDTVRLTTPDHRLDEARSIFRHYVPSGKLVSDEVIHDRRLESENELASSASKDED